MSNVIVIVARPNDPDPKIFEPGSKIIENGHLAHIIILEKGTASGKTSVAFHVKLPSGENVLARIPGQVFAEVSDAFYAAEAFFQQYPDKDPQMFVANQPEPVVTCQFDPENTGSCDQCKNMVGGCPTRKFKKTK